MDDLRLFNIHLHRQTQEQFFAQLGVTQFPDPDQEGLAGFLGGLGADVGDKTTLLEGLLNLVMVLGRTSVRLGRCSRHSRAFQSIWNTSERSECLPSFTDAQWAKR